MKKYNTTDKPNAVQAMIFKIRDLWVAGWNKREINYKLSGWNGLEYTCIQVVGSRKDLID